ncbi:10422_t:CDS:10 [Diversispora eburnea]|uniref:10422_t:CDS:1 n=1 Tax=Diversispora eburnea TaxID=1213867 RepID=A0A9N8V0L8_9GLOM|nr:10422_t:CDS:10 [Diversispora eburnea]
MAEFDKINSLLNQLNLNEEEDNFIENLKLLISGLRKYKNVIIDQNLSPKVIKDEWSKVTKTMEIFANSAKKEKSRDPLGNIGAIELIIEFINLNNQNDTQSYSSVVDFQCFRALANICISNDNNRKKFLDSGGINASLICIRKCKDLETIRGACATLLNAGMNYDIVNTEIVKLDGLVILAHLLEPKSILESHVDNIDLARMTIYYSTRVMLNLVGTEKGKQKIANKQVISSLVHLLSYTSSENAIEDDVDILENVVEILESVAIDNDEIQLILVQDGLFPILLDFLELSKPPNNCEEHITKSYGECKAAILKVIVAITNKNMSPLFNDSVVFHRFLHWLNLGPQRDDLQMCAALSLGNLARTEPLVNVLKTSDNIKVQHAVVGVLKNLSLPVQNKNIIGSLGIIEIASPLLEKDTVQPIQLGIIGIFKHLSNQNGEKLNNSEKPLDLLLKLIQRTDEIAVKSEGTRVLVNLVKNIWNTSINTLRLELNRKEIVQSIVNIIIESKYSILQNEGIIALTLLIMDDSAKVGGALFDILQNNQQKYADELKFNVCLLLENAINLANENESQENNNNNQETANISEELRNAIEKITNLFVI